MSIEEFYDRHPYPPAPADLHAYAKRWREPGRTRANFHLLFPWRTFHEQRLILVAGCGTAQAARYAIRHPEATVLGIDVSPSSLDEERRLKDLHGLDNLELRELPIKDVDGLGSRFDEIVCTGVLHHLEDPGAGLRQLASALKPDGVVHAMVYARHGRIGVTMIQEYARRLGVGTSRDEIRDLAATLVELPDGHPLAHLLRDAPDFRRFDALADALVNPREQVYAVPEVLALVAANGLAFGRWYRQAPYVARCGIIDATPHGERIAMLPLDEQYAVMELFRGTMTTHSFIAYPQEAPAAWLAPLRATDWRELVPIRMPSALTLEERTPPGAVAVLLNQEHTYTDLVMPVDVTEKRIVDAIDGERTIADIDRLATASGTAIEGDPVAPADGTQAFFEQLWWYDQVVFDASGGAIST